MKADGKDVEEIYEEALAEAYRKIAEEDRKETVVRRRRANQRPRGNP